MKYIFILILFYLGWRILRSLFQYLVPPPSKPNPPNFPKIDHQNIEDAQFREINEPKKS